MKKAHFDFLGAHLGKTFTHARFVQKIRSKKGISMKQYQRIYTCKDFTEALEEFFESRQLEKHIHVSKMSEGQKQVALQKIQVFENAFRTGVFNKIN